MRSLTTDEKRAKLRKLANVEGCASVMELLKLSAADSVSPAICTGAECDYVEEMEPDQDRGWCDECQKNTMASALILAGLI